MQINPNIFKAYDIRGIYEKDFNDETAYKIGIAYGNLIKKEIGGKNKLQIVVGSDMRLSSPTLKEKLTKGLVASGVDVIDIGLASTPTFYFAVANYKYKGGILVSASHNPKEWNGFKLVRAKAMPISNENGILKIRDMVLYNKFKKSKSKGKIIKKQGFLKEQIKHDLQYGNLSKIKSFKIVIDPANSMGALYFEELFKFFPCEVVKMNWNLDGTFPAHEADPFKIENMKDLCECIIKEKADLGIATDGDGDRIFFADEKGKRIDPGIIRAILSKIFLREKPGAKIAYDIRPGRITKDIILKNGGKPIVTRVGHSLIKAQAIYENAYFAGESSGHFFLNMDIGCFEVPIIVTLKLLQEFSESGKTISKYIKKYQKYFHSDEINSSVKNPLAKIKEIKKIYKNGKLNNLDGITVEYSNFWFNVRASNTEPLLRLNLEATTKRKMEEKRDEILKIIRS